MGADPNACRWCGIPGREHGQRWNPDAGVHTWAEPTNEQRLGRMQARRAARLAPPDAPNPDLLVTLAADDGQLLAAVGDTLFTARTVEA